MLVLIGLYFLKCTKFNQLILRKIIKIVATRCQILRLKCEDALYKYTYVLTYISSTIGCANVGPGWPLFLKCTKFDQLILRKIIKIVATRCQILTLKCTKIDFGCQRVATPFWFFHAMNLVYHSLQHGPRRREENRTEQNLIVRSGKSLMRNHLR